MLQRLLVERFRLTMHRDRREVPIYRLVVADTDGRLGPQLLPSAVDCEKWLAEKRPQVGAGGPSPAPGGRRPACMMSASRQGFITGGTQPIARLAAALQSFVGRPVVDATGLSGTFDLELVWDPQTDPSRLSGPQNAAAPVPGVSLFTALHEQLGLKLEPARGPVEVLVIDRVEQPTPD